MVLCSRTSVMSLLERLWPFQIFQNLGGSYWSPREAQTSPGWPLLQAHRGRDSYETLELGASAVLLHDSKTQSMWKHPLSDLWPAACVCRDGFTSEIETSWWDQENNWGHSSQMLHDWLTQWGRRCYCSAWAWPGLHAYGSCQACFFTRLALEHIHSLLRPAGEITGIGNCENYNWFYRK